MIGKIRLDLRRQLGNDGTAITPLPALQSSDMPNRNQNTPDGWLQRNVRLQDSPATPSQLISQGKGVRLRVLRVMLAIAAIAVVAMWYQESKLGLLNIVDRTAYPVLLAATSLGALLLVFRPESLRIVLITVYACLIAYLVADYYYILAVSLPAGVSSSYALATLALWLPLGYVAGYVFFSPKIAMRTSLTIYVAITLPQWGLMGSEVNMVDRQVIIAMLISHPVYIAALWGVAQLKTHVRGVHNLASSMSVAATIDPLTGVANRRAMFHALETVTQSLSDSERPLSLLMFDVDRFKAINDQFGHAEGDHVLIALAQQVNANLRSTDLLGRWGGEEFLILTLEQNSPQAMQMAERLRAALEQLVHPQVGTVTVSIGVTTYIKGETVDAFVKRADDALYQAKELGRNRVAGIFEEDMGITHINNLG